MNYPIVEVKTTNSIVLHGLFLEAPKSKTVLVFVHGTASNFYENYFMEPESRTLLGMGISVLSVNNRGNEVLKAYPTGGASMEHFEDCMKDIDAWIKLAVSKGYKNIILQGHSLGSEKVVYYMNRGKYRKFIKAVILLGFSDSYGTQMKYSKGKNLIQEASEMIKKGKGHTFLASEWHSHAGVLPKTADSYINFFTIGSELSKALPLRNGKHLEMYSRVSVPILAVIGNIERGKGHEYTVIPIKDAMRLLERENKNTECYQIRNCSHDFEGKEVQLTKIIGKFLLKLRKTK